MQTILIIAIVLGVIIAAIEAFLFWYSKKYAGCRIFNPLDLVCLILYNSKKWLYVIEAVLIFAYIYILYKGVLLWN